MGKTGTDGSGKRKILGHQGPRSRCAICVLIRG
jgi:hypothetical protein